MVEYGEEDFIKGANRFWLAFSLVLVAIVGILSWMW
ncbi:hypothetical protein TacPo2_82 [Pantoea bacteriophage TacPo2]